MISILIPIHDFDITPLIEELELQIKNLDEDIEIIVFDDHSSKYIEKNKKTAHRFKLTYQYLKSNAGRSKIRNLLAQQANYDYLLFLDCDVCPKSEDFLRTYLSVINPETQVIYGGRFHEIKKENQSKLRWKYGHYREDKTTEQRNKRPYISISTNNLMIEKDLFKKIYFEESLKTYGHEDTLFAFELKKRKADVLHIDNPVVHKDIDDNFVFLEKTEMALKNLKTICDSKGICEKDIKLLKAYENLKAKKVHGLFTLVFSQFETIIKKRLLSDKNNLFLFELYKLGYFCKINKR